MNIASTSFMKRAVAAVIKDHSRLEGDPNLMLSIS
jgi:hypothetical protein